MKIKRLAALILTVSLAFTGCGSKVESPLTGNWGYIHDPSTTVLSLKSNGNAVFKGADYKYTIDDSYITFSGRNGDMKLRYEKDGDGFLLYEKSVYTYSGDGAPDGLVGKWHCDETNGNYEFTKEGTFLEDGIFPGYYILSEDGSSVKFIYNDHFMDTTIYINIDGNNLYVEYPWPMVSAQN